MIRCQSCGAMHPAGTLFCDECGVRLLHVAAVEAAGPGDEHAGATLLPLRVSLFARDNSLQYACLLATELLVGRTDFEGEVRPDIDLSRLQGISQGVSRRHARLIRSGLQVRLEDLGSTNGTFVGGERLPPHSPLEIRSDDELQFGGIVLRIHIEMG